MSYHMVYCHYKQVTNILLLWHRSTFYVNFSPKVGSSNCGRIYTSPKHWGDSALNPPTVPFVWLCQSDGTIDSLIWQRGVFDPDRRSIINQIHKSMSGRIRPHILESKKKKSNFNQTKNETRLRINNNI